MSNEIEYGGFNALGRVLKSEMNKSADKPLVLDFGEIQGDYSLKTNTYSMPIPVEDYQVCRTLTYGKKDDVLTKTKEGQGNHGHGSSGQHGGHEGGDGAHTHPDSEGKHVHDVLIPEKMRTVKPGDRVLVAWVGNDAVIIDILFPGTEVKV